MSDLRAFLKESFDRDQQADIRDLLAEWFGDTLLFLSEPEFDSAIVGVIHDTVVYDTDKVIAVLKEWMSEEDAVEFFEFNIEGSRGEGFPLYITTIS